MKTFMESGLIEHQLTAGERDLLVGLHPMGKYGSWLFLNNGGKYFLQATYGEASLITEEPNAVGDFLWRLIKLGVKHSEKEGLYVSSLNVIPTTEKSREPLLEIILGECLYKPTKTKPKRKKSKRKSKKKIPNNIAGIYG